ncbi:MAG: chlorophyll synthesis pathway protein BchC [Minwuia sp.]|uniref:chlorophyll synthesis pathway protein BchC n=1 Tax=Minwuia sp. TaxID=2493630 RepID=UPI003A8C0C70
MQTLAVVLEEPEKLDLRPLDLTEPQDGDVVVDIDWSGISTGTERLLWSGRMPSFPGLGYPLVPGYEFVGRITGAGSGATARIGDFVFVPGAACFGEVRGLFGGAASRLIVNGDRALPIPERLGEEGCLMALAATAYHAIAVEGAALPQLIVGHGVLGRLMARLAMALGGEAPTVWENDPRRRSGSTGYPVVAPEDDAQAGYRCVCDVSGDSAVLDTLIARLGKGGEIVLAGFYGAPLSFAFPPAFMREARIRIAAEWQPADLIAVRELVEDGRLSLDGVITHRSPARLAADAYRTAFGEPDCLKMILDWRDAR